MDPPPSNSDYGENSNHIAALLYSYSIAIAGWGGSTKGIGLPGSGLGVMTICLVFSMGGSKYGCLGSRLAIW